MISTEEASQVSAFRLGKGSFDLLIRERRTHLLQSLVLDGRGHQEWRLRAIQVVVSSALSG